MSKELNIVLQEYVIKINSWELCELNNEVQGYSSRSEQARVVLLGWVTNTGCHISIVLLLNEGLFLNIIL